MCTCSIALNRLTVDHKMTVGTQAAIDLKFSVVCLMQQ